MCKSLSLLYKFKGANTMNASVIRVGHSRLKANHQEVQDEGPASSGSRLMGSRLLSLNSTFDLLSQPSRGFRDSPFFTVFCLGICSGGIAAGTREMKRYTASVTVRL